MPDSVLSRQYNKGLLRQSNQLHQMDQSDQEYHHFLGSQWGLECLRDLEHLAGQGIPVHHVVLAVR
jgi:hypothetical protein